MWFDARAKLTEIGGQPPATPATPATQATVASPVSRLSQVSRHPAPQIITPRIAEVAIIARPRAQSAETTPSPETFPHGLSFTGQPKTWTGRIVSLEDWRNLNEWERHGPNGRLWNGLARQWEAKP